MVVKIKKIIEILFIPMFLIFASINYGCSPAGVLATGGGSAMELLREKDLLALW